MPEWSKGADSSSAGRLPAWVRTPLQALPPFFSPKRGLQEILSSDNPLGVPVAFHSNQSAMVLLHAIPHAWMIAMRDRPGKCCVRGRPQQITKGHKRAYCGRTPTPGTPHSQTFPMACSWRNGQRIRLRIWGLRVRIPSSIYFIFTTKIFSQHKNKNCKNVASPNRKNGLASGIGLVV